MSKRTLLICTSALVFVLVISVTGASGGTPFVTRVDLETAVSGTSYIVLFDSDSIMGGGCNGIWINPSGTSSDSGTSPVAPALPATCTGVTAEMFGGTTGFGQVLLQISAVTGAGADQFGGQLNALSANSPINRNEAIFLGARGPANINNVDLSPASIPSGTSVTFTLNMDGEPPHFLGVLGGSTPVVTYDSGTSLLSFTTTTTGTTTEQGQNFDSILGFMVFTDTGDEGFPRPAKRIAGHTNHWPGDMFFLFPGFDTFAGTSEIGGIMESDSARVGFTVYGVTGEQRDISIFIPDSEVTGFFGGVTVEDLGGFEGSDAVTGVTITQFTNNFGVVGHLFEFKYTFESPEDPSIGVKSSAAVAGSGGGCLIETAANASFSSHMTGLGDLVGDFSDLEFLFVGFVLPCLALIMVVFVKRQKNR